MHRSPVPLVLYPVSHPDLPGVMSDVGVEVSGVSSRQAATSVFTRKLSTIRRVFRDDGARGIFVVLKRILTLKADSIVHAFGGHKIRKAFQVWCGTEHPWVGLLVVWGGNVVRIDSCTFLVSHPAIRTATKSLFLLGGYEKAERDILKRYLDTSLPVIELGGSIGVVACLTNKLLKDPLKHVVVEANPDLISVLSANRDRNGCAFTIVNRALAYGEPSATFYVDTKDFLGSSVQVKSERAIQVPAITLGEIIEEHGFDTCALVCDIEGGEMDLVEREPQLLQDHVATIIVEMHGWRVGHEQAAATIRSLERLGFRCLHEKSGTFLFRNERRRGGLEGAVVHEVSAITG
jgi:FkbM family methyltransferase